MSSCLGLRLCRSTMSPQSMGTGWEVHTRSSCCAQSTPKGDPPLPRIVFTGVHLPPCDMDCGISGTPESRTLSPHSRPQIIDP